jgi:CRP/FNR family transcriptional regulator
VAQAEGAKMAKKEWARYSGAENGSAEERERAKHMNSAALSSASKWVSYFPGLADIRDEAWLEAQRAAREMVIPPRTVVIRRGDPCQNFLLLTRGTVRVYESSESGREIALYRTHGGDICILTLSNLLSGSDYAAEAVTEDEVGAIMIPMPFFQNAMAHSEAFRNFIMATLARRLSDVMRVVEQVAFQRLDLRLACLLGQLFERNKSAAISMTHEDLARELGTTRVVVSRMLKEFERMGCIRLQRGQIELLSSEALERLSRD